MTWTRYAKHTCEPAPRNRVNILRSLHGRCYPFPRMREAFIDVFGAGRMDAFREEEAKRRKP